MNTSMALFSICKREVRQALASILLAITLTACAGTPLRTAKSTLWRVQGQENSVYLMGAVHTLPRNAYPLKPHMEAAFQDSTRVVFEIKLNQQSTPELMRELKRSGLYPPGDSLKKHVTPQTYAMMLRLFQGIGVDSKKACQMRPWLLAHVLRSYYLEQVGYKSELGLDNYFQKKARDAHKPISSLENFEDQTDAFTQMSDEDAEIYLVASLLELPAARVYLGKMVAAWRNGDTRVLDAMINQHREVMPDLSTALFTRRNARWLPQIERFTRQKDNYLVVVGAGHLVGSQGIVAQLKARGYKVDQL